MNEKETKNDDFANGNSQITFKISLKEKHLIEEDAEKCGVSLSEYCREKVLSEENETFKAKTRIAELEKQNTAFRVKLSYFKNTERDPNNIVLQLTFEQRRILETLYSGFHPWLRPDATIGQDILYALIHFTTFEKIFRDLFSDKGITIAEIEDTFYPPEDEGEDEDEDDNNSE